MAHVKQTWWTKAVQNKIILILLAMMIVIPFVATPAVTMNANAAAFTCEAFGILLFVTLLWLTRPNFSAQSMKTFLLTGANLPSLLFLGLILVSLARSPHKDISLQEVLRIGTGILIYFVVAYQVRRSEHITKLVDFMVYIAIGVSAIAFAQFGMDDAHYATGMFSDHQLFGSFLMLLLPFVSIAAFTEKNPNKQLVSQIGTVMTIVALLISQSRSAWIGCAAGLLFLGAIALSGASKRRRLATRKHEIVVPVMLLAVAVGFFMLVSPQASSIIDRMGSISHSKSQEGMKYREKMAAGTMKMIQERPIWGQGVGLYHIYEEQYTKLGMTPWLLHDKSHRFARPSLGEQAHDLYLQTAAELGIPGLVVFVAIPLSFLVGGLRKVKSMDEGIRRSVLLASLASTVAFAVDAAASPSWQFAHLSTFFWLVLGMGVGSLRQRNKHFSLAREIESRQEETISTPMHGLMRSGAVLAGILLVFMVANTVAYADGPSYGVPLSATISPVNPTILSFGTQIFTMSVTFTSASGGGTFDVTDESITTFTDTGGGGSFSSGGPAYVDGQDGQPDYNPPTQPYQNLGHQALNLYTTSLIQGTDTVLASFTQNSVTVTASTTVTIQRGG